MQKIKRIFFIIFAFIFPIKDDAVFLTQEEEIKYLFGIEDDEGDVDKDLENLGYVLNKKKFSASEARSFFNKLKEKRAGSGSKDMQYANVTKNQKYLVSNKKQLSQSARNDISEHKFKFTDKVLYHSHLFNNMDGSVKMFHSQKPIGTGFSSFEEQGRIPKGTNMSVDFILFNIKNFDSTVSSQFDFSWNNIRYNSKLSHCDIEIKRNGIVILNIPLSVFIEHRIIDGKVLTSNLSQPCGYNLEQKILFSQEDKIQIDILTPSGVVVSPTIGDTIATRIAFFGQATRYRGV